MKTKSTQIYEPMFNSEFLVQRGGNPNAVIKKYAKKLHITPWIIEENSRRTGHFATFGNHKGGAIWLSGKAGLGTVAHECFHATFQVLRHSGIKLNESTEETFAYYLQFLTNKIMTKLFGWK